jgi:hypothetical protein
VRVYSSTSLAAFVALLVHSHTSFAGIASRLVYGRTPEAQACPDESALRHAVAERLGYDPFVVAARTTVVAEIFVDSGRLKARVNWMEGGTTLGSRELVSDDGDCDELVAALALAVSIALDPMATGAPETTEVTPPAPPANDEAFPAWETPTTAPASPVADVPRPRHGGRTPHALGLELGGGAHVLTGGLPAPSEGFSLFARLRPAPWWSLALEGRIDLPVERNAIGGSGVVEAWSWGTVLVPCGQFRFAAACALGELGEIIGKGKGVSSPRQERAFTAALGARALLTWPLAGSWGFEAHADVLASLSRTELGLNDSSVWRAPAVAGLFGAGVFARVW